jgi:hypothetical protein
MSKLVEVIAQSTSPSPLLCWAHSANPSLKFCLAVKVGGKNETSSLFLLQEGLLYLYVFENTKITNEEFK